MAKTAKTSSNQPNFCCEFILMLQFHNQLVEVWWNHL